MTRKSIIFIALIIICSLIWFCDEDLVSQTSASFPTMTPLPRVLVRFEVEIPANSPVGEGVEIIVLDEVSGLMLNPKRYTMFAKDANHYQVELPFAVGSIVKYRYALRGSAYSMEYNVHGEAIRYRILHVSGAGMLVNDIVARWKKDASPIKVGVLKGKILNKDNKQPIKGIKIFCGGYETSTDDSGEYKINDLVPGKHVLVAYAPDASYEVFQQEAVIVAEKVTLANFELSQKPMVAMVFYVDVPQNTPPQAQVRLAGNIKQLGNAFADLQGGINGNVQQMPILKRVGENKYITVINLPSDAYIEYKYTLGNGYWNAERDEKGYLLLRQLVVPQTGKVIKDRVINWQDVQRSPFVFSYTNDLGKPSKNVFLRIFHYQWSEPIPMWKQNEHQWTYILLSPLGFFEEAPKIQYCIDGECKN